MAGPFAPAPTYIDSIIQEIASIIRTQIPSIDVVYDELPDRPPVNNSVIIPLNKGKALGETNGKTKIRLTFEVKHLFRRGNIQKAFSAAYSYVMPWTLMLAAWPNQNLNGKAISVTMSEISVRQVAENTTPFVALIVNFDVLTEYNIPLV